MRKRQCAFLTLIPLLLILAFGLDNRLTVTAYFLKKGARPDGSAWFWGVCALIAGLSCAVWDGAGVRAVRGLFLFGAAVYFTVCAGGLRLDGRTENLLFFDGVNALIFVPFRNFLNGCRGLAVFARLLKRRRRVLPVLLGVVCALALGGAVAPLLLRADSGGFTAAADALARVFRIDEEALAVFLCYAAFGVPIAMYLYGLVSGAAHRCGTDALHPETLRRASSRARIVPPATIYVVLGAICALYAVFISCQLPYFFSAFRGARPEGTLTYAEYARRGFFELCGVAAINMTLLAACNLLGRRAAAPARALKAFNLALPLITLLLLATAFSKLALYVEVYGLTMKRLLPGVFMVFMAGVYAAVMVLQIRQFSIVRFAAALAAVLLCALCAANPDGLVVRYNTARYLTGALAEYDVEILYRAGAAGVLPALEVYGATADGALRESLRLYLSEQTDRLQPGRAGVGVGEWKLRAEYLGTSDTIEAARARERLWGGV
jgi:hypothetical protein